MRDGTQGSAGGGWRVGRRLFFRHLASGVGGWFLLPSRPTEVLARAAASPLGAAKNCILVVMAGGPSHTDTFDLKEGRWLPASFNPATYKDLRFPQGLLPALAAEIESIALVRSVRSWALVHDLARAWAQIARNPVSALARIAPHIGSVVSMELGGNSPVRILPAFVSLNTGSGPGEGYFSADHGPFYVSPTGGGLPNMRHPDGLEAFDRRYGLLLELDAETRLSEAVSPAVRAMEPYNLAARTIMSSSEVAGVFTFSQDERRRYGNNAFGNACITARNLLRAGLGTRFIQITVGGWDNHAGIYSGALNAANANSVARQFDLGLGTLIADLRSDRLLEETLIVALGEFGRTVGALNSQGGRDHFMQQAVLFAGARIRGGRAIGSTDPEGRATAEPGWSRNRDVRFEDIAATIYSALGIDWTTVRRDDPFGRGFEYVPFAASQDLYGPVHELWS